MNTQTAIQLAGSKAKLATMLGVSRAAVTQYTDKLPPKRELILRDLHPEWFVNEPPMDTRIVLQEAVLTPV
tara:strand:- start:45 stop:257 length:213 start_codon:yes stop_codon:yes gene_type:complete